ncbi:DNA-directed RNA polymerase III subunit RPC6 [Penaeus vannamei]|uniref:DNA-directed RNA polymerase III subunit RPC6 n=1 Tax=Penaeus vannamei TaxID=6689 RepID=A0A3R7PFH5_PENVA|nr:DNA-directed RNA polymerase III subunit RPC6-like [Penaeus vannamei]XP_027221853.1 DNA-directed RNA polymerase III subunit RPC6-like [Penaeus vannamei]XP_027221854.1 DNA-directed RNA polymerase III subunit RPC6-like [Penaeus vannamei]XP_027221855.1 DNA-directed RNA polymerase III subunit RPC6-like [Penaeus vannamei]ROT70030.1 DNA-directed RNA polymerase III subunit RPC6 [Penaeus vannamei]
MAAPDLAAEVEQRVLQLCGEFKQGITYQIIQNDMPTLKLQHIVEIINKLLATSRIDMLKKDDDVLVFKLRDPGSLHRVKGAEPEEQVVYKIIEESGTQGIWAREIRAKSNLHLNTVDKVLRKLESKKLIKSFNSVSAPKKKTYLLYNLEPDRSLTGGAWYSDQHFDSEFVDILNQQCWRFLEQRAVRARQVAGGPIAVRNASYVASKEVLKHISDLGITKVQLSIEDIETILETLVFDGKVERSVASEGAEGVKLYRAVTGLLPTPTLMCIPCGVCPLIKECDDVGNVTPIKCRYMKEWLDLEW